MGKPWNSRSSLGHAHLRTEGCVSKCNDGFAMIVCEMFLLELTFLPAEGFWLSWHNTLSWNIAWGCLGPTRTINEKENESRRKRPLRHFSLTETNETLR